MGPRLKSILNLSDGRDRRRWYQGLQHKFRSIESARRPHIHAQVRLPRRLLEQMLAM